MELGIIVRLPFLAAALAAALSAVSLSNDRIVAEFGDRGLTSLHDSATRATWHFNKDDFSITIDRRAYNPANLQFVTRQSDNQRVRYSFHDAFFQIEVTYELRPGWRFLTKQLTVEGVPKQPFAIQEVVSLQASLAEAIKESYVIARANERLGTGDYGACLRFERSRGLLVTAQNPFLSFNRDGADWALSYKPDMQWNGDRGPFESDLALLAPYELTGNTQPEKMLPEWKLGRAYDKPGLDDGEVAAFTDLVRAFLLYQPSNPLNIMVGWCANDYQIDIATPEGRAEYKRILDRAAELGVEHVLFAPANSAVSRRVMSRDDWKWEYVLWLGLGQKIRRNEWDPATGPIPDSVREMLDYARAKDLGLVAYVYPVMAFEQSRDWLVGPPGASQRASLGFFNFQAWLVKALEGFLGHTGITGYAFDHAFLNLPGTSMYAQWWGWRRVLETLRKDSPDIVIDGRQAYQHYGPWTWLAGSYPHPTSTDEQPESFVSFPDLKLDRVSADRERYTAFWYRRHEFAPSEIVPGFITHQTARNDDSGHMPARTTDFDEIVLPFRRRDWDYLGWRYSLLSSIAVAGWNNVVDMIPARDPEEFRHFSAEDRDWFRHWIDFADARKEYLRNTVPILGQPAIGKVDGTAAFVRDRGYVFLFNPNGRRLSADFTLDDSIGFFGGRGRYTIRELYPLENRLIGKPGSGVWSWGDNVSRELDGGSAVVLEIEPAERSDDPVLYNSPGSARVEGTTLHLSGIRGEAGTTEVLQIAAPSAGRIASVELDGRLLPAPAVRNGLIELPVTFEGARFRHYQQLDAYRTDFTGGPVSTTFRIPARIFDQLARRRKLWPIPWTEEDYGTTWLVPERLLLYVQFAEPDDRWTATLKIDGRPVDLKKAYASIRPNPRNFVGLYADISQLSPDADHRLELDLPSGLKPGQYQGVFVENVETEYTGASLSTAESRRAQR